MLVASDVVARAGGGYKPFTSILRSAWRPCSAGRRSLGCSSKQSKGRCQRAVRAAARAAEQKLSLSLAAHQRAVQQGLTAWEEDAHKRVWDAAMCQLGWAGMFCCSSGCW